MELVTLLKGQVFWSEELEGEERKANPTNSEKIVQQKFLAMAFVECADTNRFKGIWKELKNGLTLETDNYPKTLASAVHTPQNRRDDRPNLQFHQRAERNTDPPVGGTNGIIVGHVNCWKCGSDGHYASVCPNTTGRTGYQGFQRVFAETAINTEDTDDILDGMLNVNWILINSGSNFNSFMNPNLLGSIKMCEEMRAYSN